MLCQGSIKAQKALTGPMQRGIYIEMAKGGFPSAAFGTFECSNYDQRKDRQALPIFKIALAITYYSLFWPGFQQGISLFTTFPQ